MPPPDNQNRSTPNFDWLGIVRILLIQVMALLVLSAAAIRYVNWSSDVARAEFTAAGKAGLSDPTQQPQPSAPVQTVKGQKKCSPKA
jgi:hypothetical protein